MVLFPPRWGPHADRRKRDYGILNTQIAYTWLFGEKQPSYGGYWRLIGEEVTLVLDADMVFIMTLYPTRHRDRFIARNARFRRADGNIREEWLDGTYSPANLRDSRGNALSTYVYRLASKGENDGQVKNTSTEYDGS